MYIDILLSYKDLEHDVIVKKIRPIEVIFNDFNIKNYGGYRKNKVINRELMVDYIDYLIDIINKKNDIFNKPILDALNLYRKYKHYETIKEKLIPIESYLSTNYEDYFKNKRFI